MVHPPIIRHLRQKGLIHQQIESIKGPRVRVRGRWYLSFVSSSYLGINQSPQVKRAFASSLQRWGTSLGTPRVVGTDRLTIRLEAQIARLVGREKALIFPSTTQLALDVLPMLAGPEGVLFVDEQAYPTSLEGAYAARRKGAKCYGFKHNSARALSGIMEASASAPNKVIVCDGVYVFGGHKAALVDFVRSARKHRAFIYIDDAHGIGIFGDNPSLKEMPYGFGGTGTPGYFGFKSCCNIIHVGTLSKALGVPIAFAAGHSGLIEHIKYHARSYIHSSPPSIPEIAGAIAALDVNFLEGDGRRNHLFHRVRQFRRGLREIGVNPAANNYFPIQTILFPTKTLTVEISSRLKRMGIWILLQLGPPDNPEGGAIRFVITALHGRKDIDLALDAIDRALKPLRRSYSAPYSILGRYAGRRPPFNPQAAFQNSARNVHF